MLAVSPIVMTVGVAVMVRGVDGVAHVTSIVSVSVASQYVPSAATVAVIVVEPEAT